MCSRIVQRSDPMDYMRPCFPRLDRTITDPVGPSFNVWPGSVPLTLHCLDGAGALERHHWGYRPRGTLRKLACAPLARVLAGARPWRSLAEHGRILVPVDGWYEWSATKTRSRPSRQPYYIHRDQPIFLAALSGWRPGEKKDDEHGFAIVTDDILGGVVDVKGRRPVALPVELAMDWMDPVASSTRALELLREGLPKTAFGWHPVRREMSHWRYSLADAIAPI